VKRERSTRHWLRRLPNALSAARILAAPALLALAWGGCETPFAALLIAALVTDVVDGWLARRLGAQSAAGAALDSFGDLATLIGAAVGVAAFHRGVWQEHALAIGAVLGGWALVCLLALVRYRRLSSFHTLAAKIAGYALGFFIVALFGYGFVAWLFYAAVGISLASTLEELALLYLLPHWRTDVRGVWWVLKADRTADRHAGAGTERRASNAAR